MAANTSSTTRLPRHLEAQDTVTRPAGNTTQYAVGDAISDNATTATAAGAFTFTFHVPVGSDLLFTDFTMHKTDPDVTAGDFDLLLFTTLPALTTFEDNVAAGFTAAELRECKGVVRFATAGWAGGTAMTGGNIQTVAKEMVVVLAADSQTVYGILVAAGTYTPADAEAFTILAKARQS